MLDLPQILLARNNDDGPFRFLGILVIVGIFILGNVLQWWQKYQAQQRKQAMQRQAEAPVTRQGMQQPAARKAYTPAIFPKLLGHLAAQPRPVKAPRRIVGAQRALPVARQAIPRPLPVPGAHATARRPVPPAPVRRAPVPAAAQPQPEITQPGQASGQQVAASASSSRALVTTTRAHALRALFKPRTLQQIYVLTEILQPPLSIREPRV